MAAYGLLYEPEEKPDIEIWAENANAAGLFGAMQTQWVHRADGKVSGISYTAIKDTMKLIGIKKRDRPEAFRLFQRMEQAGKEEINRG